MGRNPLKFREDGTFKIVQITDLHLNGVSPEKDMQSLTLIENVLADQQPDLIVFTGDVISSMDAEDQEGTFRRAIDGAVQSEIPFAVIYGNHDSEKGITREQLNHILTEFDNNLSENGPEDIHGIGNYVLTVAASASEADAAALYFLDSGDYAPEPIGGYAWIHPDQVAWYRRESAKLTNMNGGPLPALAFFHIPIPEYDQVWHQGTVTGHKGENVCCPKLNSGLFASMLEMGDVMGTFAGHDHDNDYIGTLHGIQLCYGRVTGYSTYGRLERGVRVINLLEGKREFHTWLELDRRLTAQSL
ncbi:metallophosphoesterase family protein [Paenibacillus methanolicus]|uniref:Calcineurin-like phosphoesterase family protein n=1 Tax=Paenibacillus methanolicus TaxID=582686 RepID=A0A5S5CDI1_9BACL|nr:metallophosphoesterase family protein [Paenibacillus methanolicus]TYP76698.1 calcineurin-like phosphoesterase family protein [Paenibacillus methanolicus]